MKKIFLSLACLSLCLGANAQTNVSGVYKLDLDQFTQVQKKVAFGDSSPIDNKNALFAFQRFIRFTEESDRKYIIQGTSVFYHEKQLGPNGLTNWVEVGTITDVQPPYLLIQPQHDSHTNFVAWYIDPEHNLYVGKQYRFRKSDEQPPPLKELVQKTKTTPWEARMVKSPVIQRRKKPEQEDDSWGDDDIEITIEEDSSNKPDAGDGL